MEHVGADARAGGPAAITSRWSRSTPDRGPACSNIRYEGVRVTQFSRRATTLPIVRNVVKNEWLWRELTAYLSARIRSDGFDLVHGQHVMSTIPSIGAGHRGRDSVGRDRARLLAGLLLVRPHLRSGRRASLSIVQRLDDDAMRPSPRRRRVSGGVAADSVHARQPRDQAALARAGQRHHRRQPCHCRRPASARARALVHQPLHDSQSRGHDAARCDPRTRRLVRWTSRT